MKSQHEETRGIWIIGSIVAVVLLSLILGGCGGAGGGPTLTGEANRTTSNSAAGEATGTVRNAATQEPIQGVTVTIGGQSDVTGPDGRYHITDITRVGIYSVTCAAPGWTVPGSPPSVQINGGTNNLDDIFLIVDSYQPPGVPSF